MIQQRLSEESKTEDLNWEEMTEEVNEVVGLELEETDKVESARSYPRVALSGQGLHHSYDRMVQGYCEARETDPDKKVEMNKNHKLEDFLDWTVTKSSTIMSSSMQWLRKREQSPHVVEANILWESMRQ